MKLIERITDYLRTTTYTLSYETLQSLSTAFLTLRPGDKLVLTTKDMKVSIKCKK